MSYRRFGNAGELVRNPFTAPQLVDESGDATYQIVHRGIVGALSFIVLSGHHSAMRANTLNDLLHYTLNTGHTRKSPRSEVSDDAIAALAPLLIDGDHAIPGHADCSCQVSTVDSKLLATVFCGVDPPWVMFGVAPDDETADKLWPLIERQYLTFRDSPSVLPAGSAAPSRPETTPWCAVMVIFAMSAWLVDFERCLAWAWIERMR